MIDLRGFLGRALIAAVFVCAFPSSSGAGPNARPQLSVGSVIPTHWGTIDDGVVYAGAVETEQNPRWSTSFEFEYLDLRTDQTRWDGAQLYTMQIGVRVHMMESARIRPYAQAGLGMRIGQADVSPYAIPASGSGTPAESSMEHGMTGHVRLGVTTAAYRGAGLFIDATLEAILKNPRDYGLAPIRVGLTLP